MPVSSSFEDLAQSLRVLLEADYRAHRGGLLQIDRAEAVGNIETALSSVLNAFHSLYDAVGKSGDKNHLNWNTHGELATILAIRNARHHNHANKIRTIYTFHVQEALHPKQQARYVFVDFPSPDPTAETFTVFLSWRDLEQLLKMPVKESRISQTTNETIQNYLGCEHFAMYADRFGVQPEKLFLNVTPLLVNAAALIVPKIINQISPKSTEAEVYAELFANIDPALISEPKIDCRLFALDE